MSCSAGEGGARNLVQSISRRIDGYHTPFSLHLVEYLQPAGETIASESGYGVTCPTWSRCTTSAWTWAMVGPSMGRLRDAGHPKRCRGPSRCKLHHHSARSLGKFERQWSWRTKRQPVFSQMQYQTSVVVQTDKCIAIAEHSVCTVRSTVA
jgi:hypothetical protein